MTGWELKAPLDAIRDARSKTSKILVDFLANYKMASVNEDLTILLIYRHFESYLWEGSIRTLNAPPERAGFQKGLTVVTCNDTGASSHNIYLPNNYNYLALNVTGITITIVSEEVTKITNIQEINQLFIFNEYTQEHLENIFLGFNNKYVAPSNKKVKVKNNIIKNEVLGKLVYNKDFNWYATIFSDEKDSFYINVCFSTEQELGDTLSAAQNFIQKRYHVALFDKMQHEMLLQKNEYWLDENEIPTTKEQFCEAVGIESITFYTNNSSTIYCFDGDLFGSHTILIHADDKGRYINAELAG